MKIESQIQSLDDLESIPVARLGTGRILLLGEIAEINLAETDPTSFALLDGDTVLNMLIKKEFGSNTVEVFDTLMHLIDEIGAVYLVFDLLLFRYVVLYLRI